MYTDMSTHMCVHTYIYIYVHMCPCAHTHCHERAKRYGGG